MVLTCQIKLLPTKEQAMILEKTLSEYISLVNDIVDYAIAVGRMPKLSSASVHAPLPSALRDQCRLDAKSVYKKSFKEGKCPVLRKPVAYWNNQNYKFGDDFVKLPVWLSGICKQISIRAEITAEQLKLLKSSKLGSLRVLKRNGKWIAQAAYKRTETPREGVGTMGIDLGLKCPAVSVSDSGKIKFFGNGRHNKYVRRYHSNRRKKLGKTKKLCAIRKLKDKESRWMKDQDHKISRSIINYASANHIGVIKLEQLAGIRASARKSRKNNHSLHGWSFYRLAQFIEYKAALAGIQVEYVDPKYTSQRCPECGKHNHAKDRAYRCSCGYHGHRDLVGARNILVSPAVDGHSLPA